MYRSKHCAFFLFFFFSPFIFIGFIFAHSQIFPGRISTLYKRFFDALRRWQATSMERECGTLPLAKNLTACNGHICLFNRRRGSDDKKGPTGSGSFAFCGGKIVTKCCRAMAASQIFFYLDDVDKTRAKFSPVKFSPL